MPDRTCASLDLIPAALAKTGFILEHQVAQKFRDAGWSTIGGRYYADDVDGRARELDLVAYRTGKTKDLNVVTAVLVSCKKDSETTWAFLTKDKPKHDPNFDWDPVHYWTDVEPLKTYLANDPWKEGYIKKLGKIYEPFKATKDIFAFQQIASNSVVPRNDRAIFDSIVSLMKALDHEVGIVPARAKGRKRIYVFSLLSVVDAPMVEVNYSNKSPRAAEVARITHLARYMVRKRDLSALINFVRSDKLAETIKSLSLLADANTKQMAVLAEEAYSAVERSTSVRSYFSNKLTPRLAWRIERALKTAGIKPSKISEVGLEFRDGALNLLIEDTYGKELAILNADKSLMTDTAKILKELAKYEGKFVFESDFPF